MWRTLKGEEVYGESSGKRNEGDFPAPGSLKQPEKAAWLGGKKAVQTATGGELIRGVEGEYLAHSKGKSKEEGQTL